MLQASKRRGTALRPRRTAFALLFAGLVAPAGCAALPEPAASKSPPAASFSPESFFAGRTEGMGELRVLFSAPEPIRVESQGRVEADGTLVLRQRVTRGDAPPTTREWRMRRDNDGKITGSLTEASGPVTGELRGNRLDLRYRMKGGLSVSQRLTAEADGRTVSNELTVRAFGLPVARLDETIRKK